MKALFTVGLIVIILGILSFFIPVPYTEHHGLDAGDIHVGVNTHHSDLLPPYVGVILIAVGAGLMVAGRKKAT
jgi:nucleoside recognition membrane protein YjiH